MGYLFFIFYSKGEKDVNDYKWNEESFIYSATCVCVYILNAMTKQIY